MEGGKIYQAIVDAMNDIGAIGKNKKNQQQGFMYRGIDAVMNAIQPALIKNKIFVVPQVLEQTREERQTARGGNLIYSVCRIKYTFFTTDGSSIETIVVGEGMDSGDKATNKAMSIAFKYACFQVFCIPTEEMKDPDAECHEVAHKKQENFTAKIRKMIAERGIEEGTVLKLYKVNSLDDMTKAKYENLVQNIDKVPRKENTNE